MNYKKYLMIIVGILLFIGITVFAVIKIRENNNYELSAETTSITLYVNDNVNLISYCNIVYKSNITNQRPTFVSYNVNVIEVDALSGEAHCKTPGVTQIKVTLKLNNNSCLEEIIAVEVKEDLILPIGANFDTSNLTMRKNYITTNKLNIDGTTNITPTVTYQNNLVTYNYLTGEIISGDTVGVDKVTVTFNDNSTVIEFSFYVTVIENNTFNINYTMAVNETKLIEYDEVTQLPGETFSAPMVADESVINVLDSMYGYVYIKAIKTGTTTITITSSTVTIVINILVT